jgi:hypothetical protein
VQAWAAPVRGAMLLGQHKQSGRVNCVDVGFVCCVSTYPTREPMTVAGRRALANACGDIDIPRAPSAIPSQTALLLDNVVGPFLKFGSVVLHLRSAARTREGR